jgi:LmbE family N-acetylglucosaminyl deacetylase
MAGKTSKTVALIVAHPGDETLWAGGMIMSHPSWQWYIVCLCRGCDNELAPRFYNTLKVFKAEGIMGTLDDGPDQKPLSEKEVEHAIMYLLPPKHFDLVITHNPTGEYTKHLRNEEISRAVIALWNNIKISTYELWTFAYEDGDKQYLPKPIEKASLYQVLPEKIWERKYNIITKQFGFEKDSWEAETTPKAEAFWKFTDPREAKQWIKQCDNMPVCVV